MGIGINGYAEYWDGNEWEFIDTLPFIPRPYLYYRLFGQNSSSGNPPEDIEPIAPERGIPDQRSDGGDEWVSRQTDYNPVTDSEYITGSGHSYITMDEFPPDARSEYEDRDGWSGVFEMVEPFEDEYGAENVRLVVSFHA